jgi:rare lipoprotein A
MRTDFLSRRSAFSSLLMAAVCALATGCSHHINVPNSRANLPVLTDSASSTGSEEARNPDYGEGPGPGETIAPPPIISRYVEVGMASWYGPKYNHRRGADGNVYDENGLTAAHRTLPLGSIVRVTNLRNGVHVNLRITDRGPFVPDRMIDLSIGAAKALAIWPHGTSQVRVELISSPPSKTPGGRWCVQIGAFTSESNARKLKEKLQSKYSDSEVLEFGSPTGDHWVRIRPPAGNKREAYQIAENLRPVEGNAYLLRLD